MKARVLDCLLLLSLARQVSICCVRVFCSLREPFLLCCPRVMGFPSSVHYCMGPIYLALKNKLLGVLTVFPLLFIYRESIGITQI